MARLLVGAALALGALVTYPGWVAGQEGGDLEVARTYPLTVAKRRLEQSKSPAPAARPEDEAKRPVPKIVGGQNATKGLFPWQVALISSDAAKDDPFPGFFCGGSLIGWQWVLTAAHCVYEGDPPGKPTVTEKETVHVYLGSHDFSGGRRLEVERIIPHEAYNTDTQDNDIALLKLVAAPADKTG
jgi:secreted trypsin-like serine protease